MVEFALVLPILLLILLGVLDFARVLNYWIDETHVAAAGARSAVVNQIPSDCGAVSLQQCIFSRLDTAELKGKGSVPNPAQVCIAFPGANNPPKVGDPVKVTVTATYNWLKFLGLGTSSTITGSSVMRLEQVPSNYSSGCT